jgi:hypothetical protein
MSGRLNPDICDIVLGERVRLGLPDVDGAGGLLSVTSTSCCLSAHRWSGGFGGDGGAFFGVEKKIRKEIEQ